MGKYFRKAKNRGKKVLKGLKTNSGLKTKSTRMPVTHTDTQNLKQKDMNVCYLELRSRKLKKIFHNSDSKRMTEMNAQEVEESNCSGNFDHVAQNFSSEKVDCSGAERSSKLVTLCNEASREEVSSSTSAKQSLDGAISRSSSFSALAQASFKACINQGEESCVGGAEGEAQRHDYLGCEDFLVVHSHGTKTEISLGDNSALVDQGCRSLRKRHRQKTEAATPCSLSHADMDDKIDAQVSRPSGRDSDEKTEGEGAAPGSACKTLFGAPSRAELEEFFAEAEQQHQKLLTDRYNFDFQNDVPLRGRYEWICLTHS